MGRVNVLGQSGTGKSYHAGTVLERVLDANHPNNDGETFDAAVHFDLEDEEKGLSDKNADPLYDTLYVDRAMAQRLSWVKVIYNHRYIRVVPEGLTTDESRALYAEIAEAAMKFCKDLNAGSCFVSCDEAHNLVTQADFREPVERMITGGRKHGLECLHISQRPQLLHSTVISQADLRIYFRISDSNDLNKVDGVANFPTEQVLKPLPSRVCVEENKDTGDWAVVVTDTSVEVPESVKSVVERDSNAELIVEDSERIRPHYSGDDGIVDQALSV